MQTPMPMWVVSEFLLDDHLKQTFKTSNCSNISIQFDYLWGKMSVFDEILPPKDNQI